MKHKLLPGLLMSLFLVVGFFTFNTGVTHAAVHSHAQFACGFRRVESDNLINASGLHVGVLMLYENGCGSVEIDLHVPLYQGQILAISLSDGSYYQLYSRECGDVTSLGSPDCWSLPIYVGTTPVFAGGGVYDANYNEQAWAYTGWHTGYH